MKSSQPQVRNALPHAFLAIFAIAYGASPIDLIPDLIPLLGWTDDWLVLLTSLCVYAAARRMRQRAER